MKNKMRQFLAASTLAFFTSMASAGVVDFTGLSNFTSFSQNGMNMTSGSVWNWPGVNMAHMDSGVATFKLATNADFNLDSVLMVNSGGSGPARFTAYNNNNNLGFVDISGNVGTYSFGTLFDTIDEFRVSVIGSHFTFDDINFSAANNVPEPGSIALLGLGLVGLALRRRKAIA